MIDGQTPPREWKTKGGKGKKVEERAKLDVARVSDFSSLSHTRRYTHIIQIVYKVGTYTIYLLGSERVTVYTTYLGHVSINTLFFKKSNINTCCRLQNNIRLEPRMSTHSTLNFGECLENSDDRVCDFCQGELLAYFCCVSISSSSKVTLLESRKLPSWN